MNTHWLWFLFQLEHREEIPVFDQIEVYFIFQLLELKKVWGKEVGKQDSLLVSLSHEVVRNDNFFTQEHFELPFFTKSSHLSAVIIVSAWSWTQIMSHASESFNFIEKWGTNSYKKLRTITLDHAVRLGTSSGIPSVCLELDRDVLLVRVRTSSKTRTLIWR